MNFLAHLLLSGDDDEVIIGNFIGDYVKGHDLTKYSEKVRKGIMLHRNIDWFTDNHPIVRENKKLFQKFYGKYAGILIDIIYDHFLIMNWKAITSTPFPLFVDNINATIRNNFDLLPVELESVYISFIKNKWLLKYETLDGIELVFNKMSQITSLPSHTKFAIDVIKENYQLLNDSFMTFFPQLQNFVEKKFSITIK